MTIYKGIAHQDTAGREPRRQRAALIRKAGHGGTGSRQHYSMGAWSCRAGIHWQYIEHRSNDRAGNKGGQYDHIQRHSTPGHGRTGAAAAAGA